MISGWAKIYLKCRRSLLRRQGIIIPHEIGECGKWRGINIPHRIGELGKGKGINIPHNIGGVGMETRHKYTSLCR